jgi:hypothetical protein
LSGLDKGGHLNLISNDATAKSRKEKFNAKIRFCKLLILFESFNLKLNTACKNIFFAGAFEQEMIVLVTFGSHDAVY